MAVRELNGVDDVLDFSTGALSAMTYGTIGAIVQRSSAGSWHSILTFHNASNAPLSQLAYSPDDEISFFSDSITSAGPAAPGTSDWGLVFVRKDTGTAAPRFTLYDYTADVWTHADGDAAAGDWGLPQAGGLVTFHWSFNFDLWHGRVAVRAAWANSLPWAADATGDAALEAAGLETSAQNWFDASPSALWYFNQDSVDTDVIDQMGNGANQTSRIGTAVITGDDPPGFSFATSMPVSGSGEGSLSANLAPFDQQNTGYTRGDSTALSAWMRRGETPLVIANPGFEIDTSGWFVDGGTLQRATAQFNSGTASGLIVPDGVTATVESGLTTGASPSVVEGVAYTASIWAYSATGHPFRLVIQWEDGGGSGVGSDVGDTVDPLPETWTLISVSGRAPSGAATVSPRIRVTGTPTGDDLLYIDDMSVSTDDLVLLDSPLIA